MKTKHLCLTLLLMLTALCTLTPRVLANDGDWLETNYAIWWWKYVQPATFSNVVVSQVYVGPVRSTKPGYLASQVTVTFTNKSDQDYKGGDSYLLETGFCEPVPEPWKGPSIWRPITIGKGVLSSLPAGRSLTISGIAYTPDNGKYDNYALVTVGR